MVYIMNRSLQAAWVIDEYNIRGGPQEIVVNSTLNDKIRLEDLKENDLSQRQIQRPGKFVQVIIGDSLNSKISYLGVSKMADLMKMEILRKFIVDKNIKHLLFF